MPQTSRAARAAIAASREPSRAAIAAWRESAPYRAALIAFAQCSPDDPEPAADAAETLLGQQGWVEALLAPLVDALTADPWFEPPFKVSRDRLRTGALLLDCPAATLTMSVLNAAALRPPGAVAFTGRVAVTRTIRAGGAQLRRWRAEPDARTCTALPPLPLHDGMLYRSDGRHEAQCLDGAQRDVVTLVATIRAGASPLVREHDPVTGALLRLSNADDRPSRTEMLLRFLRVSGRADAGTCFDQATRDPAFHLRWAAMREWLALDAHSALPRLVDMAAHDSHPEVRTAAAATLARIAPQLQPSTCRA